MDQIDLSGLRDIHLPTEPNFWPLATGWYILIIGLILSFLICFIWWRIYQNRPLPYALRELEKIQKTSKDQLKLLSQLLKRVAMAKYGRKEVAPLTEDTWQDFLLSAAPDTLTQKQAHLLAFAVYAPKHPISDSTLYKNARLWIKRVLKSKKS